MQMASREELQGAIVFRTGIEMHTDCYQLREHLAWRLHEPAAFLLRPPAQLWSVGTRPHRNA